jgi:hypothetical protein
MPLSAIGISFFSLSGLFIENCRQLPHPETAEKGSYYLTSRFCMRTRKKS